MIMERGARPDVFPKPKRAKTAWVGVVGVAVVLPGLDFGCESLFVANSAIEALGS